MSDTINVLNTIIGITGKRGELGDADNAVERESELYTLLTDIAEAAGDCLEEHVAARNRAKPRKQRVYKAIVEQIAVHYCDEFDEDYRNTCQAIREILVSFNITTKDFEDNVVKIT